jgi:hypothetical protein
MAIVKKIPTVSNRVPTMAAMAAGSVIVLCAAATAAILGWMPAQHQGGVMLPPVSMAPEAADGALRQVVLPEAPVSVKKRTPHARPLQTASAT